MSDYIIKIIPTTPDKHINTNIIHTVENYLQSRIKADEIQSIISPIPMFIDCGSNLEKILCPFCQTSLDFDWWGEAMDNASAKRFQDLTVILPCCNRESSLNDLHYHFPCGFANTVFQMLNPLRMPDVEEVFHIQKLLGEKIRVIHTHV